MMPAKQGDPSLLYDPIAQELLQSAIPARLAYTWRDGAPRVVPIWFHWNGQEVVMGTPKTSPKVKVLLDNVNVSLTIDSDRWPYKVLLIRGVTRVQTIDGVVPEYAAAAERYLGRENGRGWIEQAQALFPKMVRIAVKPVWVSVFDFEDRFPSAVESAMSRR